jgi:hypothetical protein
MCLGFIDILTGYGFAKKGRRLIGFKQPNPSLLQVSAISIPKRIHQLPLGIDTTLSASSLPRTKCGLDICGCDNKGYFFGHVVCTPKPPFCWPDY